MTFAHTAPATLSKSGVFSGLIPKLRLAMSRRAAYNQTYRELSMLDDRELNDIGLSRYDIGRIARDSADRV